MSLNSGAAKVTAGSCEGKAVILTKRQWFPFCRTLFLLILGKALLENHHVVTSHLPHSPDFGPTDFLYSLK
jgi:hypothetical protein